MNNHCKDCRFWSEMIAEARGSAIFAVCLGKGPHNSKYTHGRQTCAAWKSNHYGAIDDPKTNAAERYAAEEGEPT